ncbi:MAG: cell division protein FtsA [Armatimonadota bacterium]|nr:cell division protein FtsA [Armatimonadota bacterium]
MSRKDYIAGLDIGTTKTCCVLAEVDTETRAIDIIGVGLTPSEGLKKGVVVDLDATTESIRAAVEKTQRMAGSVTIKSAVVSVTGEHISSLNSRGVVAITNPDREIRLADVERVIEASKVIVLPPEREIIHAIPRGFVVDGQDGISDPVGMSATRLEVETHIVTGSTVFLDNIVKCVHRAGLVVDGTVLESIAASEAVVLDSEKQLGVALVDIGGGTTDIAVFAGGEVYYTSVIPVGGNHVTNDIAVGLRTSREEAERIKIAFGAAEMDLVGPEDTFEVTPLGADSPMELPREVLVKITEPRMQEILHMVRMEISKSGQLDMLPAGIVLTGGSSLMPGTVELAKKTLNPSVRIGVPRDVGALSDTVASPIYSAAVGLIKYAAKEQTGLQEQEKTGTLKQTLANFFKRLFG